MLKSKTKYARLTAVLTMAALLVTMFVPAAFALNYNGGGGGTGNKPIDFNGYELVDRDTLKIFFNKSATKSAEFDKEQFSIKRVSDESVVNVTSMAESTGSGCSDTKLTQGTTEELTLASQLDYDTLYKVTIDAPTVADDNYLTLGNYRDRQDFTFYIRTPDSSGVYSTTYAPKAVYTLDKNQSDSSFSETDVAYEHNLGVVFDRPMYNDATTISSFLSSLSSNYTMTSNGSGTVVQDSTIDNNTPVAGGQCYTPHANDAHTFFFFPQTVNTSNYAVYNRFSTSDVVYGYRLTLPNFVQSSTKTWTSSDADYAAVDQFDFSSLDADLPAWLDNRPTVGSATSSTLTVSWSVTGITNCATTSGYDVYRSTNEWKNFAKINTSLVTGTSYVAEGLASGTKYYFRIVPVNSTSYLEAGFSVAGSGTTTI